MTLINIYDTVDKGIDQFAAKDGFQNSYPYKYGVCSSKLMSALAYIQHYHGDDALKAALEMIGLKPIMEK